MDAGPYAGRRARTGWIAFAGAYLLVAGVMNGIWGLAAVTDREVLRESELAWSNLTTWGWLSLVAAATQLSAGALVLAHRVVGRALAGVIAFAGLFVNFLSVGAYPVWSILAVVANGLVLWAVTVYGDAFE
ncbi:MAG TPA: hypothetical protein VD695_04640 [Gaiellaceae bacterium]|nr:hypothetical protein [Gaiellaceae bacterium]